MKKILAIIICGLLASCASHTSNGYDDESRYSQLQGTPEELYKKGTQYAKAQNFDQAMLYYKAAARQGYPKAQYAIGYLFRSGHGVERDYNTAAMWFERAAKQGNPDAQLSLGMRFLLGQGTPQDFDKALYWFQEAAAKGNHYAENELGYLYAAGKGVAQSYPTAISWYEKAAKGGLSSAQYNLGLIYANGIGGTPVDKAKANEYFRAAAARGFAPARKQLGQYS